MKDKLLSFWRWASPGIVAISVLVFIAWIGIELYFAAIATDNETVLFHKDIIVAIVTGASLLYLVFTLAKNWEMASAARDAAEASRLTLQQMRDARDEETAPYVLAYFNMEYGDRFVYFIIKNIGKTSARDIHMEFNPPIQSTEDLFKKYSPVINGVPSLVPGQEIRTFFGLYIEYKHANLPTTYQVKLTYRGGILDRLRENIQILDISIYEGRMYPDIKDLDDLVRVNERIANSLETMASEIKAQNQAAQDEKDDNTRLSSVSEIVRALSGRIPITQDGQKPHVYKLEDKPRAADPSPNSVEGAAAPIPPDNIEP